MSTKRPADKTAVSKRQMSTAMRSPLSLAIHSLLKPLPMQAVLPHPSNGETKSPPSKMVSKTIQQPIKKAVISKCMTNTAPCLPLLPTIPVPPTWSIHVELSCKAGIEPKTPVQMATKRHTIKTSAASTSSVEDQ